MDDPAVRDIQRLGDPAERDQPLRQGIQQPAAIVGDPLLEVHAGQQVHDDADTLRPLIQVVDRADVRVSQRPGDQDFLPHRVDLARVRTQLRLQDLDRQRDSKLPVEHPVDMGGPTTSDFAPVGVAIAGRMKSGGAHEGNGPDAQLCVAADTPAAVQ